VILHSYRYHHLFPNWLNALVPIRKMMTVLIFLCEVAILLIYRLFEYSYHIKPSYVLGVATLFKLIYKVLVAVGVAETRNSSLYPSY